MEKSDFLMEVPGEIRLPREACVSSPGIGSHPSEMQERPHKLCKARRVCIPRSLRGRAKGNLHGTKPKRGFLPHPFPHRCSLRNPSLLATASPPFSPLPPRGPLPLRATRHPPAPLAVLFSKYQDARLIQVSILFTIINTLRNT